jgi:hypothetical protein
MMACHRLLYQGWWKLFWSNKKEFEPVDLEHDARPMPDFCEFDLGPLEADGSRAEGDAGDSGAEDEVIGPLEDDVGLSEPSFGLAQFLSSCPDDKDVYIQPERVRAKRAGDWISDPLAFMEGIWVTIIATAGTIRLLYFIMKEQKEATWSGQSGLDRAPLVQCAKFSRSNIVFSLDIYADVMENRPENWFQIFRGNSANSVQGRAATMFFI